MVVYDPINMQHGSFHYGIFGLESRLAASMVGNDLCICFGFYSYSPFWGHSSYNQPGNKNKFIFLTHLSSIDDDDNVLFCCAAIGI